MLHFSGGIALRVDVADLLELQGAFQSNRVIDAAPQKDHILGLGETGGQPLRTLIVPLHEFLQLLGQIPQRIGQPLNLRR